MCTNARSTTSATPSIDDCRVPPLHDYSTPTTVYCADTVYEDIEYCTTVRSSSSSPRRQRSTRPFLPGLITRHLLLVMNLILLTSIRTTLASVRCFNTDQGSTIGGAEYHRVRGVDHRSCAMECRDDPSCLAYEWNAATETCFLKSRSLSGNLEKNDETIIGFCLDEDDEMRDRFYNHEIDGPITHEKENIDGEECRGVCMQQAKTSIYSWVPNDLEEDEPSSGTCRCIESIRSLTLKFNSFSGFLPVKRHKFRF